MVTLERAKAAKRGDVFINANGHRWRVNGRVKTWKRDPSRVQIPVKHGLYDYDYMTEHDLPNLTLEGEQ